MCVGIIVVGSIDGVDVANIRIVYVDVVPVASTCVIPGTVTLSPTQREPPHTDADSKPESKSSMESAKETDERGAVVRTRVNRARAPTPAPTTIDPAAVVKRCKSPRRIINPRPSPRSNPVPISIAVRSPICINIVWIPNVSVGWLFLPRTIIIQVAVAHHLSRNIFRGSGIFLAQIALLRPVVKLVRVQRRGMYLVLHGVVGAGNTGAFPGVYRISLPACGHFALAADHRNIGRVT